MEDAQPNAITEVREYTPPTEQVKKQRYDEQQKQQIKKGNGLEKVETFMGVRSLIYCTHFVGIHMPKKNKLLYALWAFTANLLACFWFPAGFFMTFLTMSGEDLEIGNFLTSLQAAINDLAAATKIMTVAFLLNKLLSCEHIVKRLDKRCHTKEEIETLNGFVKKGNRTPVMFYIVYLCYTSSTCLSALIFHRLPYNIYNPLLDIKASDVDFYLAFFLEWVMVNLAISQQVVSDSYPVIFVNMIRTHLKILSKRIENLNSSATESLEANVEELKMCIIDHKNIIEIYDIVAPIISITIFVQFTVTATILCVIQVNILIFAADFGSIIASSFYLLAVTVEIFPLCYYAQCLMDESNRLPDVIFHSNWVDQDVRYRKMLIFFIHRSQRTIEFLAGKLFPITLSCFLSIAKFSFSLYTFIKQMGLKEKFTD